MSCSSPVRLSAGGQDGPRTFEFVLNLEVARTLGLTVPPSIVLQADRVIE